MKFANSYWTSQETALLELYFLIRYYNGMHCKEQISCRKLGYLAVKCTTHPKGSYISDRLNIKVLGELLITVTHGSHLHMWVQVLGKHCGIGLLKCMKVKAEVSSEHDVKMYQMLFFNVVLPWWLYMWVCWMSSDMCCVLEFGYSTESLYTVIPPGQVYSTGWRYEAPHVTNTLLVLFQLTFSKFCEC